MNPRCGKHGGEKAGRFYWVLRKITIRGRVRYVSHIDCFGTLRKGSVKFSSSRRRAMRWAHPLSARWQRRDVLQFNPIRASGLRVVRVKEIEKEK